MVGEREGEAEGESLSAENIMSNISSKAESSDLVMVCRLRGRAEGGARAWREKGASGGGEAAMSWKTWSQGEVPGANIEDEEEEDEALGLPGDFDPDASPALVE